MTWSPPSDEFRWRLAVQTAAVAHRRCLFRMTAAYAVPPESRSTCLRRDISCIARRKPGAEAVFGKRFADRTFRSGIAPASSRQVDTPDRTASARASARIRSWRSLHNREIPLDRRTSDRCTTRMTACPPPVRSLMIACWRIGQSRKSGFIPETLPDTWLAESTSSIPAIPPENAEFAGRRERLSLGNRSQPVERHLRAATPPQQTVAGQR